MSPRVTEHYVARELREALAFSSSLVAAQCFLHTRWIILYIIGVGFRILPLLVLLSQCQSSLAQRLTEPSLCLRFLIILLSRLLSAIPDFSVEEMLKGGSKLRV